MIKKFYIHLDDKPMGKSRPRFSHKTRTVYKKSRDCEYEKLVKYSYLEKNEVCLFEGPIKCYLEFIIKPAESLSDKKKAELIGKPYISSPDNDNLEKAIWDALNGVAYKDDRQIYDNHTKKLYGTENKILVILEYEEGKKDTLCKKQK